jgi:hypothetical protein
VVHVTRASTVEQRVSECRGELEQVQESASEVPSHELLRSHPIQCGARRNDIKIQILQPVCVAKGETRFQRSVCLPESDQSVHARQGSEPEDVIANYFADLGVLREAFLELLELAIIPRK